METTFNHVESNTKIYFTTDYGRFKFLKGNRDLDERKVNKIKDIIQQGVDVLKYAPIIVNEAMQIIDGQHRYVVSKELRTNVYYVIHKEADLTIVPAINSNHTKWKNTDFLNSYIDLKKHDYIELREFLDQHPGLSLSTAVKLFHDGTPNGKEGIDAFRDGQFKLNHYDHIVELTEMLTDFIGHMDNPYSSRMYLVMLAIEGNGKYDHGKMIAKLRESGRRIEAIKTTKTIISEMESIINHKMRDRVYIQ